MTGMVVRAEVARAEEVPVVDARVGAGMKGKNYEVSCWQHKRHVQVMKESLFFSLLEAMVIARGRRCCARRESRRSSLQRHCCQYSSTPSACR
eukprot:1319777-Prymnesium_polylepis.1